MPIRFSCPHCSQKLSVSTRKAGKSANCPRCKKELTVPAPEPATVPSDSVGVVTATEGENEDDPYSQFVVYDDAELVYDDGTHIPHPGDAPSAHDRVSVPRYVLYTQGLLLGAVALTCFIFGVLTGGTFFSAPAKSAKGPCTITGTVRYASGNQKLPDDGAVIIVLPDTKDAGQRASVAGMRPDEPLPETPLVGVQQIRDMGGGYTRAGPQGDFSLNLASGGKYYVLVLSSHTRRAAKDEVKVMDVRTLGQFMDGAIDLLGDSKYQLTSETFRGDRALTAQFD
jgi:hypothetical protein